MADLDELRILLAVVDHGSFTEAARSLSRSRSAVSRAIGRLEERLGVRLLHRTTRRVALTSAGRAYCAEVRPLLAGLAAADDRLSSHRAQPRGDLRVGLPMDFGVHWLGPALHAFQLRWPEVRLEVRYDDRKQDLMAEGLDLVLRGGVRLDQNLVARQLWAFDLMLVASPAYLRRRGRPGAPADLIDHDCLRYTGSGPDHIWPLVGEGEALSVSVGGRMSANTARALADAAVAGLGITMLPEWAVCHALADGRLEVVLPGWNGGTARFWVVRPSRPLVPARVRVFIDHLAGLFEAPPWRAWRQAPAAGAAASPGSPPA